MAMPSRLLFATHPSGDVILTVELDDTAKDLTEDEVQNCHFDPF
jgi:hypothetical protein